MELFEGRFVHFLWKDELKGKEGFFADSIGALIQHVQDNTGAKICESEAGENYPFYDGTNSWQFFYYDPNYECKRAAAEGKKIQWRDTGAYPPIWRDTAEPKWYEGTQYRLKPESNLMTYRQLAEWLAKGNGQCKTRSAIKSNIAYGIHEAEDEEVPSEYRIRCWDSEEWIAPAVEIYTQNVKNMY